MNLEYLFVALVVVTANFLTVSTTTLHGKTALHEIVYPTTSSTGNNKTAGVVATPAITGKMTASTATAAATTTTAAVLVAAAPPKPKPKPMQKPAKKRVYLDCSVFCHFDHIARSYARNCFSFPRIRIKLFCIYCRSEYKCGQDIILSIQ